MHAQQLPVVLVVWQHAGLLSMHSCHIVLAAGWEEEPLSWCNPDEPGLITLPLHFLYHY